MFKIIRKETSAEEAVMNRHQWAVEFTVLNSADDSPAKVFVMHETADPAIFADSLSCVANAIQMTDLPEDSPLEGSPFYRIHQTTTLLRSAEAAAEFVEKVEYAIQNLADNLYSATLLGSTTVTGISPYGLPAPDMIPTAVAFSPRHNSLANPVSLSITFHEDVAAGSGNITLRNLTDTVDTVIAIGSEQVVILDATVTVTPDMSLPLNKDFAVRIDAGAIEDLDGNAYAGILDDTTWNFKTAY